ncbi:hypothetical protein EUX98_g5964 [Antrodiella citrinella]|uniref:Uncharacterized protein n=1 Tax=Antrodiella citrinella TaxID=2447956 RepID=A0A4S4MSB6_9APHY|nr:hypothetical protein EUX98_g5964 [Antrodiella citrinella]
MLPQRVLRLSQSGRLVAHAPTAFAARTYATQSDHSRDPLHQSRDRAKATRANGGDTTSHDAASSGQQQASHGDHAGNPEGVGFTDQVGSHSASANKGATAAKHEGFGGQENITPPSFTDAVKNKVGMGTTAGEDKQNRGGAVLQKDVTKGQAPKESRKPKENTNGDQNEHLEHTSASSKGGPKRGKGNAAENPTLPSHQFNDKPKDSRGFTTSAVAQAEKSKHTADSYFKDVDSNPPNSGKTFQVDSSADGAQVQRANEPQSGEFMNSGPGDKEYDTMSKKGQPYDTPPSGGPESNQKLRYGGTPGNVESEKKDGVSSSKDGPQGASKGGRKPEGRS